MKDTKGSIFPFASYGGYCDVIQAGNSCSSALAGASAAEAGAHKKENHQDEDVCFHGVPFTSFALLFLLLTGRDLRVCERPVYLQHQAGIQIFFSGEKSDTGENVMF